MCACVCTYCYPYCCYCYCINAAISCHIPPKKKKKKQKQQKHNQEKLQEIKQNKAKRKGWIEKKTHCLAYLLLLLFGYHKK